MEKITAAFLKQQIADVQAEIDDCDLFGGDTSELKQQLATLKQQLHTEQHDPNAAITLQTGEAISTTRSGGWGRMHYVSYAQGSRKHKTDYWMCAHCQKRIEKGEEHYRRSYYLDKSDCRSGRQIRLCLNCYAEHQEQYPPNTTFPVYRPARAKVA